MKLFYFLIIFLLAPCTSFAAGVIGQDMTITVNTLQILDTGNPEYDAVYNFFFTTQIFIGLVAFYLKLILRIPRL